MTTGDTDKHLAVWGTEGVWHNSLNRLPTLISLMELPHAYCTAFSLTILGDIGMSLLGFPSPNFPTARWWFSLPAPICPKLTFEIMDWPQGSHSPPKNLWSYTWNILLVHIYLIFLCCAGWEVCTYRNIMTRQRGESALKKTRGDRKGPSQGN